MSKDQVSVMAFIDENQLQELIVAAIDGSIEEAAQEYLWEMFTISETDGGFVMKAASGQRFKITIEEI